MSPLTAGTALPLVVFGSALAVGFAARSALLAFPLRVAISCGAAISCEVAISCEAAIFCEMISVAEEEPDEEVTATEPEGLMCRT